MIGDPAWRWREVLMAEMLDHVVVPVVSIVPALTLAILLATRHALRPLDRVARQAAMLGDAAGSGGTLAHLPTEHLPLEFHQVVSAINIMLTKLETTLSLQKQFTSDAAHELRTPLSVLLLQADQLPPDPVASNIREELRGLSVLVNQLLQFAQAEDAMQTHRAPVDVGAVARKVCEDLAIDRAGPPSGDRIRCPRSAGAGAWACGVDRDGDPQRRRQCGEACARRHDDLGACRSGVPGHGRGPGIGRARRSQRADLQPLLACRPATAPTARASGSPWCAASPSCTAAVSRSRTGPAAGLASPWSSPRRAGAERAGYARPPDTPGTVTPAGAAGASARVPSGGSRSRRCPSRRCASRRCGFASFL